MSLNIKPIILSIKNFISNYINLFVFIICCVIYLQFGYYTPRENFISVLIQYTLLFIGFGWLYLKENSLKKLIVFGIIFRLLLLICTPNLSNDFYRFIWDGRAMWNGLNPYLILPKHNPELLANGVELYQGMGKMNGSHFTCYPPLNQYAFIFTNILGDRPIIWNTIIMRLLLIISDLIAVFYGIKLLTYFKLNPKRILLYFINPFIILELTGNLHFEGMMIALLLAGLYYILEKRNTVIGGVLFGLSISVKLIPLIFIPLFYHRLRFKKFILFSAIIFMVNAILFIPFLSLEVYENFMSSIELYFQNFEFNASIFYIIRAIGFQIKGYNIIHSVGKITPFIVILFALYLSFFKKNNLKVILLNSMLFTIVFYYALSSIVHPWYLSIPLIISIFTRFYFPLVWSFVIILSYSAYQNSTYHENLWWVAIEYIFVFIFMIWELCYQIKSKQTSS